MRRRGVFRGERQVSCDSGGVDSPFKVARQVFGPEVRLGAKIPRGDGFSRSPIRGFVLIAWAPGDEAKLWKGSQNVDRDQANNLDFCVIVNRPLQKQNRRPPFAQHSKCNFSSNLFPKASILQALHLSTPYESTSHFASTTASTLSFSPTFPRPKPSGTALIPLVPRRISSPLERGAPMAV